MTKRSLGTVGLAFAAMGILVASALAANVSHPATYTGTAATGGTVEFDVSADGAAVTRFALKDVPVPPCGTVSGQATGSFPIANDSFSNNSGLVHFNGTFPAVQQAQGSLSFHFSGFPSCNSQEVAWSATTPTPPPVPPDTSAPNTKIKAGPSGETHIRTATFRFAATEPGSTFQCKLDGKPWRSCRSPKTYKGLKDGKHTFKVRAKDAAGNVDRAPAKRVWRVDRG